MIEGTLAKPGGGKGKPPPFRVTVPSVDVDWKGFAGHLDEQGKDIDENGEDARHIVVPLNTNGVADIRQILLNSPFDDDEREGRRTFPYGKRVNPDISLGWEANGVLKLIRMDGTSRIPIPNPWNINARDFDNPRQWPLLFEVAPLQATKSFTISAEGQEDDVKDKALDRIHGRVVNVDIDVDSDYDGDIDDDDESLETTQGGIMCAGGENLAEINLAIAPDLTQLPGKLTLSATKSGNRIRVWQDGQRTTELVLPKTWRNVGQIPGTLYVEGLEASAAMRDVELTLEYDETPAGTPQDRQHLFKCEDKIALTIINVDLIGYAAWRGMEDKRVPDEEEFDPGFLVTTDSPNPLMAKLTFKAIPLAGGDFVRSYKVSRGGFAYFDNVLTTAAEAPILGSADKSFIVCMEHPDNLNDEDFSFVDVEYIVRHRNGAILGKDKCRLLRPYVVAVGDSLTYGVWGCIRNGNGCTNVPLWKYSKDPYPTAAEWSNPSRVTPPENKASNRLLPKYQGYRGYLAQSLSGFTWLGENTNGHGPSHNGYPGAKISSIYSRLSKDTLNKSPSYTFVIYFAGMNNCNRNESIPSNNRASEADWLNKLDAIKGRRLGKGRSIILALKIPPTKANSTFAFNFAYLDKNIKDFNEAIDNADFTEEPEYIKIIKVNSNEIEHAAMSLMSLDDDGLHFDCTRYKELASFIFQSICEGLQ